MRYYLLVFFLYIGSTDVVVAQDDLGKVFVRTNKQGEVFIKYFGNQLIYQEGVNIYRSNSKGRSWTKLNNNPIVPLRSVDSLRMEEDTVYESKVGVVQTIIKENLSEKEDAGLLMAVVALQSITDSDLSDLLSITYQDANPGKKQVAYKVSFLQNGNEVELGISETIKPGKPKLRTAPKGFRAKGVDKAVQLAWDTNPDQFYAYKIYKYDRSRGGNGTLLSEQPILVSENDEGILSEYLTEDIGLVNDQLYYYELSGLDAFGNESASTKRLGIAPTDTKAPPPPYNVSLVSTITDRKVTISWEANENDRDIAGLRVYRSIAGDSSYALLPNGTLLLNENELVDSTLSDGKNYQYVVSTIDRKGNESFTDPISSFYVDDTAPAPIANFQLTNNTSSIQLSWDENNETDLWGYKIYRKKAQSSTDYELMNSAPLEASTYIDSLSSNSKVKYLYRVGAIDTSYNISRLSVPLEGKVKDELGPPKPYLKSLGQLENGVEITWLRALSEDVESYFIFRRSGNTDWQEIHQLKNSSKMVYIDALTEEGNYEYQLKASDELGNRSDASNTLAISIKKKTILPDFEDIRYSIDSSDGTLTLEWELTPGSYKGAIVYRKSQYQSSYEPLSGMIKETSLTQKLESFTDYVYKIVLFADDGTHKESRNLVINP